MKTKTDILNYRVVIEQDEEGKYVASVPTLQGCYTEGDTYEEVVENIEDAINLHVQTRNDILIDDSQSVFVGIKNISIPYGLFTTN
jgi:predicted RNase H-like HicB family nuclease